ncbi:MAG TPA: PAS domain S-box protein, partial [Candidatus Altiarchaeales archaeon]|nr:PAS domain S-box protein [Candidatus Altiarchaeales archaeon]
MDDTSVDFKRLVDEANDGFLVSSRDGVCLYANRRMAEIMGVGVDEIVGSKISDFAHPPELARLQENLKKRVDGGGVNSVYGTRLSRKDGTEIFIEVSATKVGWAGDFADLVI